MNGKNTNLTKYNNKKKINKKDKILRMTFYRE